MRVGETAESWLTEKMHTGRITPITHANQLRSIRAFAAHIGAETPINDIRPKDVMGWILGMRRPDGRHYAPASRNTIAAPVRAFFAEAAALGWIDADPCRPVARTTVPETEPKALTRVAVDRLLHAPSDRATIFRDRTMIVVTLNLGLRIVEVSRMRVEHYDQEGEALVVYGKGSRGSGPKVRTMPGSPSISCGGPGRPASGRPDHRRHPVPDDSSSRRRRRPPGAGGRAQPARPEMVNRTEKAVSIVAKIQAAMDTATREEEEAVYAAAAAPYRPGARDLLEPFAQHSRDWPSEETWAIVAAIGRRFDVVDNRAEPGNQQ